MPEDFIISHSLHQTADHEKSSTFAEIEKQAMQIALRNNNGSVLKASKELGLARQTMYNKMQKYNL
jgi:transcriptional regulator of acetoin/glycerol metabolism